MANQIDISDLLKKRANAEQQSVVEEKGISPNEKLTAEEFVSKIVQPIIDLQKESAASVKKIVRGSTEYVPNSEGVVMFPSEGASVSIIAKESIEQHVETGERVILHLRIHSTGGGTDTGNSLDVEVQRYVNGEYKTAMTAILPSRPASYQSYDELDITSVLADGDNQIRLIAKDKETLASGRIVFASIIKASLSVTPMFAWERAITDIESGIPISYAVFGTGVEKTLYVRITDNAQDKYREFQYVLGMDTYPLSQPFIPTANPKDDTTDTVKIMTHGVHTIEAWVTTTAAGNTYASPHIKNQVMVVADTSSAKSYLLLQQKKGVVEGATGSPFAEAENYVQTDELFGYAVYNPANPSTGTKVSFSIDDYDELTNSLTLENMAKNNTQYTVPATIQIEGATVGVTSFVYLSAKDGNGVNFLSTKGGARPVIAVVNNHDFSPVNGADFYLNPANRSNTEENPARILNAAKRNAEITAAFEGFSFDQTDGWLEAEDGQRVLRVLAGQKVTFAYDPFSEFRSNPAANVTIDFVLRVRNVTNEEDPVISIANDVAATGKFLGLKLKPLEGCVMTTSKTVYGQQNFGIKEDKLTHLVINICSAIYADPKSKNTIPLVRVFVNSSPDREFMFSLESGEWGDKDFRVEIGQSDAEIDIYSMRVYRKAVSAQGCLQNYKSSLPTANEKIIFAEANDILDADGTISYEKARKKYNCIVHYGRPTSLQYPDSTKCWLHIDHFKDGKYDAETSGDICKETKSLPVKGQGSTAKHYADWNQQYDAKKTAGKITVDGVETKDGWVDGNGKYRGAFYQLDLSDAKAEKLVGKINYASSMQSHKMGATNAFNDLYRLVMGSSLDTILVNDSKARCAVKEDMFFFFMVKNDGDTPVYKGIMTFGSGKMDKKTWGYDSKVYPDFAMFEGADNDQPITNFERPWNDEVTYNPDEEYFEYNGKGNIDFDAGAVEKDEQGNEIPTGIAVDVIKDFINFGYLHCTDLSPWTLNGGTATSLIATGNTIDTHRQYWVVNADSTAAQGELYSWSPLHGRWVKAGLNQEARNVFTENPDVSFSAEYDVVNAKLIESIIKRFKAEGGNYYNVRSKLFHSCFVENLIAGSDNCAKNTYYVCDPLRHIICFHADDLDTIFKTDNVGWQTKPYYVDRVHHIDENGNECYSGTHNFFFNTFDRAYETEKQAMMKDIFTAMASLAGSVQEFFNKYFFGIQRSIPAIAYIEQARVRYEIPQIKVNNNEIILDTVNPITQQLGSQLDSEMQYMERRLTYFQSYAAYGNFGGLGGNNFGFRGFPRRNGTGARIAFTLKPHQYIYPTAAFGQTVINPHVRLSPRDTYEIVLDESCSSDTTCSLYGIDYYKEIGNLGDLSVNPAYELSIGGKRLTKIEAYPTDGTKGEFRPAAIKVTASLVNSLRINVANAGSNIDLRGLTRLRSIDLKGSSLNRVNFPESKNLTTVELGTGMTAVSLQNVPGLQTLTFQGYGNLEQVSVGNNTGSFDSYAMIVGCYNAKAPISKLTLENIGWNNLEAQVLRWICGIDTLSLTGEITVKEDNTLMPEVNFELKNTLIDRFGNVDEKDSPDYRGLWIGYTKRDFSTATINGNFYNDGSSSFKMSIVPATSYGNTQTKIVWETTQPKYGGIVSIDQHGELSVAKLSPVEDKITVSAVIHRYGHSDNLIVTKDIEIWDRPARLGDYVFADGTYSDQEDNKKTVVGICVYVPPRDSETGDIFGNLFNPADTQQRLMVSMEDITQASDDGVNSSSWQWGPYSSSNDAYSLFYTDTDGTKKNFNGVDQGFTNGYFYDIQSIANITSPGLAADPTSSSPGSIWYIGDDNLRDISSTEGAQNGGFRCFPTNVGAGDGFAYNEDAASLNARTLTAELAALAGSRYKEGDIVNSGYAKTLKIIRHRNAILKYGLKEVGIGPDLAIPAATGDKSELNVLANSISALRKMMQDKGETNYNKWGQIYTPAISAAYAYQPERLLEGEVLNDKFKAHNWFLPPSGIEARMYWYYRMSKKSDERQNYNIFKRAIESGKFKNFSASHYWTVTENNSNGAWNLNFDSGTFNNINGKASSLVVRAVAAF